MEEYKRQENFEEENDEQNEERNCNDDLQSWNEQECYEEDDEDILYSSPFDQIEPVVILQQTLMQIERENNVFFQQLLNCLSN